MKDILNDRNRNEQHYVQTDTSQSSGNGNFSQRIHETQSTTLGTLVGIERPLALQTQPLATF